MVENAMTLALILGPTYLVIGLSVLFYVKPWQKLMDKWEKDHFVLFPLMFWYIPLGIIIVQMYNEWTWNVWLLVTITGWAMIVKGVAYFLLPGTLLKKMMMVKQSTEVLYLGGLMAVIFGAVLSYYTYFV